MIRVKETAPGAKPVRGMSLEEGRQFWAFQPISNPRIPDVQQAEWVKTPIDAFILARLEERGLKPAPEADRPSLIRRATFDLIACLRPLRKLKRLSPILRCSL